MTISGNRADDAAIIAFCNAAHEAHSAKAEAQSAYADVLKRAANAGVKPAHIKRYIKEIKRDRTQLELFEAEYSHILRVMSATSKGLRAID